MVLSDNRVCDSSSAVSHLALALFLILSSLHFLSREAGARREGRDEEFWMEDHLGDCPVYSHISSNHCSQNKHVRPESLAPRVRPFPTQQQLGGLLDLGGQKPAPGRLVCILFSGS